MERSQSISNTVFDYVEEAIISGEFKSGEIISELKICKLLNVSRTPVREAFTRLNQEGLLKESGKGSVVVGINISDIEDIYEIRMRIEGVATAKCTSVITNEQLEKLREVLELQEFYTFRNQPDNIKKIDNEFHRLIYLFTGSRIYESILSDLHRKVSRYRRASFQSVERAKEAVMEHRMIYDAISEKDPALAEKLTIQHIKNAQKNIIKTIN